MRLFLLIFFLAYGGMHLYAFLKARYAFGFGAVLGAPLALFMAAMIAAPVIVRISENAGFDLFARLLSFAGYTWMGVLFLFFSFSLVADLYQLVLRFADLLMRTDLAGFALPRTLSFLLPLVLALCMAMYGFFEAGDIRTERLTLRSSKIPKEIGKLTIVQISDVHLGLIVREQRLKRIIEAVRGAAPDILVSTGDLVDGQINDLSGLVSLLQEIKPRYGKYAITGNHEFYAGIDQALDFTRKAGFTVLRGESVDVHTGLTIVGIDDQTIRYFSPPASRDEREILSSLSRDRFVLFLKHRPLISESSLGLYDLQLSGHVHKGQIFPFTMATWLYYPVASGYKELPSGSRLYVSRGSGTWGPPIRFLATPEVTVIDLVHQEGG